MLSWPWFSEEFRLPEESPSRSRNFSAGISRLSRLLVVLVVMSWIPIEWDDSYILRMSLGHVVMSNADGVVTSSFSCTRELSVRSDV